MDVWSVGIMTYVLLSGNPPFNGSDEKEIIKKVKAGRISFQNPVWDHVGDSAKDFIRSLLTIDRHERPSAQDALNHPWMLEVIK